MRCFLATSRLEQRVGKTEAQLNSNLTVQKS